MYDKLRVPILLLTLSFIVGVALAGALDIEMWTSLLLFGGCGVLYFFRGWSVLLLSMMLAIGMMRGSSVSYEKSSYSHTSQSAISELLAERVHSLELSPRAERVLRAMVLGDRTLITRKQREAYGRSGASHILAVSGLHLSIIFVLLNILLLPVVLLPRGHIIRNFLVVALIWGYAYVVGFMPSVVRGAVMFTVLQMSWVVGRAYSGVNSLLFALFAIVFVSPTSLYSLSFQLSIVAVAAIYMWALQLYYRLFRGGGGVVMMLCIGVTCSVATLPLVSHVFGYFPLLGVLFSPIYVAAAFVIVSCGAVWIVMPTTLLDPILRLVVESAAMVQERVVEGVAAVEWGYVTWQATAFQMWVMYGLYVLVTILIWQREPSPEDC